MADDGSGRSINVPSVLIHKFDGQKIKSSLQAGNNVQLSMTWSLPEPDGRVEVRDTPHAFVYSLALLRGAC